MRRSSPPPAPASSMSAANRRAWRRQRWMKPTSSRVILPVLEATARAQESVVSIDTRKAPSGAGGGQGRRNHLQRRLSPDLRSRQPRRRCRDRARRSCSCMPRASPRPCRPIRAMTTSRSTSSTISQARIAACEAAGIARDRHRRRSGHRLRQDARAQSRAPRQSQPVAWPWRAAAGRRLAQALHCRHQRRRDRLATASLGPRSRRLLRSAQGAQILRVHDVAATRQALEVWRAGTQGRRLSAVPVRRLRNSVKA